MDILITDEKLGKRFLIRGHGLDYEIFRESAGKKDKDGNVRGKGEWTTCRLYPTSLPYAVYKVVNLILADPDDTDQVVVQADKIRVQLGKIIHDRLDQIIVTALKEVDK